MHESEKQQWGKREGYDGPGSFPRDVMGFVRQRSQALAGQEHTLYLSDGRVLHYAFTDTEILTVKSVDGGHGFNAEGVKYKAFEGAPGVFIVSHGYPGHARLNTSIVLDTNSNEVIVVDDEIPGEGDADFRVRESRAGGCIGKPATPGEITPPLFPTDLIGRRFTVNYADIYTYEIVFLTRKHLAWHCFKGNAGIAAVEEYAASQLSPGVVCLSWSEQAESLAAVMLMNFSNGKINGNMFGYDPENKEILNFALGSEMIDSAEYGVNVRGLTDT